MSENPPLPEGQHISVFRCEHGTIFVTLHDDAGKAFAFFTLDAAQATQLSDRLLELLATEPTPGASLANVVCAGHG